MPAGPELGEEGNSGQVAHQSGEPGESGLYIRTLRGLAAPRRAVPVGLVCLALITAQMQLGADPAAGPLAVFSCLGFLGTGPYLWRRFNPHGLGVQAGVLRTLGYVVAGLAMAYAITGLLPVVLGVGPTLLAGNETSHIPLALFLVGGWGLGRDLDYEEALARTRARAEAMEREAQRAQLLAVRSHLDPHFLFNTLNAIAEWCHQDGEVAERAILKLSAMLRTILTGVPLAHWSLRKEFELVHALLDLHLVRDPQMFDVTRDVRADLNAHDVPPLILLPLIENAVKHGPAAGHRGGIRIQVSNELSNQGILIKVQIENPGVFAGLREGGHGFPTVEQRLSLAYDGAASITIEGVADQTRVTVWLPAGKGWVKKA